VLEDSDHERIDAGMARAKALRESDNPAEAAAIYVELISQCDPSHPRLNEAYALGLLSLARCGEWKRVESLARAAIEAVPGRGVWHQFVGEALLRQGHRLQGEIALKTAIQLEPQLTVARDLLQLSQSADLAGPRPATVRAWPRKVAEFESPASVIKKFLVGKKGEDKFIRSDTRFLTLGSCFARNLGVRLAEAGYQTTFEAFGEEVNSTYANRYLLEWIEKGVVSEQTAAMQETYGYTTRKRLFRAVRESDVFVMTLGLAPCFFKRDTGEFAFFTIKSSTVREFMFDAFVMRTTKVSENVENIRLIFQSIFSISGRKPRIVLTVSPVPLAGTNEFDSAITADCLSKSILRVACQEAMDERDDSQVLYWPSFEIVRWLGTHFSQSLPPVFGVEDGNSRHVSAWVVNLIIDQFLSCYAIPSEAKS